MNEPIDPRLRDALRGLADGAPSGDDLWDKTGNRIAVHRRRRAIGSSLASAAVVLAVAGGIVAINRDTGSVSVTDPSETTSTTAPTTDTTQPSETDIGTGTRVAAFTDGRIATVDDEWKPVQTIARVALDGFVRQLAIAPDGSTVYYLVDDEPGPYGSDCAELLAFNVETRRARTVDRARSFSLSPDGVYIALGMHGDASGECASLDADGGATVRVVQADDGITTWDWSDDLYSSVEGLAWDPIGERLAAEVCAASCRVAIIDVASFTGPFTPLEPADQTLSVAWGDDGLRTLEVCCRDALEDDDTRLRLRSVDPATGEGQELQVFDGEAPPPETELLRLGDEWYLLRRTSAVAGVESELSRIDLGSDQVLVFVAEGITAVAER